MALLLVLVTSPVAEAKRSSDAAQRKMMRMSNPNSVIQKKTTSKNPVRRSPVKIVLKKSSSSSARVGNSCTLDAWTCEPWNVCSKKNSQTRTCTVSRYSCQLTGGSPRPAMNQSCSFFEELPKRMQSNINLWEALHAEMTQAAKTLVPQGDAGKAGIAKIDAVEMKFLLHFDEYLSLHAEVKNLTLDLQKVWDKDGQITNLENKIKKTEDDFRSIAKVWY